MLERENSIGEREREYFGAWFEGGADEMTGPEEELVEVSRSANVRRRVCH